jgi:hypothetical protein
MGTDKLKSYDDAMRAVMPEAGAPPAQGAQQSG